MPSEMLNTKQVAEYLGIHEKQVYALIKAGKIPCTRVTGKWVFPKKLVDEWIVDNARESIGMARQKGEHASGLLAAGSNDPVLDILLNSIKQSQPGLFIFSCSTGSTEGLRLLESGLVDIAWCHLYDPKSGEYNLPFVSSYIHDKKIVVVHLFYRELGFVSTPGGAGAIKDIKSLASDGVVFINRQKGSGTRIFLDHKLQEHGIDTARIRGYDREVYTHFEVGLAILSGAATAGIATVAVSKLFGLPFISLVRESFDMVLPQETFFENSVQGFIAALKSEEFRKNVEPLGNYDFNESGKIMYASK